MSHPDVPLAQRFEFLVEQQQRRSKRLAWGLASVATLVAVLCAGALMVALPLKQTDLAVVTVDNTTGRAEVITTVKDSALDSAEVLDKYFASLYLRLREQYNYLSLQHDYFQVQEFGVAAVNNDYLALYNGDDAPDVRYRNGENVVDITVISNQISPATSPDKLASIRFKRTQRNLRTGAIAESYAVARLTFRFVPKKKLTEAMRETNPLGFTVTSYQVDEELRGNR